MPLARIDLGKVRLDHRSLRILQLEMIRRDSGGANSIGHSP